MESEVAMSCSGSKQRMNGMLFFRFLFNKSWEPVSEVQSSQPYNHKRQGNLIKTSRTGSPHFPHVILQQVVYSPCERKPDHRHMLFIHSVCCTDGDTRVLVWKWTAHPHVRLPIRGAVSVELRHSSLRGVREPLGTARSHNKDQYSSDTWLWRPLVSSGCVVERAKKWWKSHLIKLWGTVGNWKQEWSCFACVFFKKLLPLFAFKKHAWPFEIEQS